MGIDVYALVAEWQPAVDDCRSAGGLDFCWDAEVLPYAVEHWIGAGKFFTSAVEYYYSIEDHLPEPEQERAEAFLGLIYGASSGEARQIDDLGTDAGLDRVEDLLYSMRPSTVLSSLKPAETMPWQALEQAADAAEKAGELATLNRVDNHFAFKGVIDTHVSWMEEAAASGRGLIVHWSY